MKTVGHPKDQDDEKIILTLFTWPNVITFVRFLGVPYFSWLILHDKNYGLALLVLIAVGTTDWIDGWIARRFHQVSYWGQVLDPIADRVGISLVALTLVVAGVASWWFLLALVIPDIIIFLFGLFLLQGSPEFDITYIGKVRTTLLLIGVPLLLVSVMPGWQGSWLHIVAMLVIIAGCIGHWVAGFQYFRQCLDKYAYLKFQGKRK